MTTFVALSRGVNVGGRKKLPMHARRASLADQDGEAVSTNIQSGNVVFRAQREARARLAEKLSAAIADQCGFTPDVLVLDEKTFRGVLKNNPFASSCDDPSKLFVMFLKQKAAKAALGEIAGLLANGEQIETAGAPAEFHAPADLARIKA